MPEPSAVTFAQLHPPGRTIAAPPLLDEAGLGALAPADRPYVAVNFAATVDGRIALDGRSGAIGDAGDRAMFHALRGIADAVLAGTNTLRAERYGRLVRDGARRAARSARGLAPDPLAVVISRSGELPLDVPLFASPESRVAVFTPEPPDGLEDVAAQVELHVLERAGLAAQALGILRRDLGVRLLLCEGGASLFAGLLAEGLVDELFLTLAPKLAGGGDSPCLASGPALLEPAQLRLRWLLERDDSLFLRYAVGPEGRT